MKKLLCVAVLLTALATSSQAQRKTQVVEPVKAAQPADGKTIKRKVAIGRFSNETQYAKGIFYDKENDPMGKQALDILSAKLAASGKFLLSRPSTSCRLSWLHQVSSCCWSVATWLSCWKRPRRVRTVCRPSVPTI